MLDLLWIPLLGGVLIGAVSLVVGGLPLALSNAREIRHLREDFARLADAQAADAEQIREDLTREVKRRASEKAQEARRGAIPTEEELRALNIAEARVAAPSGAARGLLRGVARGPA